MTRKRSRHARKKTRCVRKKMRRRENFQSGGGIKIEKFIEKKNKDAPKEINGVPLVVYRSWITEDLPKGMYDAVQKTIAMTPEFDNQFFTDADCLKFIEEEFKDEPNVANAFRCLKPGAFQSNLWRCCILYKKGGVYINIPAVLHIPLIDVLKDHPTIFIRDHKMAPCAAIWDGFMSSAPGNIIFKRCIDAIVENCKTRNYGTTALDVTGPCLLGKIVTEINGPDYIKNLPFEHVTLPSVDFNYNGKPFFSQYPTYREEQKQFQKTAHYGEMWNNRDIYDLSVKFV